MGPLGFFSQKNLKTIILSKNVLRSFKPLCCWHFLQKSEKLHPLTFHNTSKPHLGQLCPLSHQKPQNKTSRKKQFRPTYKTFFCSNSCKKKTETFHALIFHVTWKNSFWVQFGDFWLRIPKTRCFSKKIGLSHFLRLIT